MVEKLHERLPEAVEFGKTMIDYMLARSRNFGLADWAMFKLCLVSFGVLIGSTFSNFFKKLRPLMTVLFCAGWVYMVWRVFLCEDDD
ncbi:MAG: hypothetical protein RR320_05340 [Oscillospiraceae bacterium]